MTDRYVDQVAIIGAGISGLAAAIALSRRGAAVQLFERAASLSERGAGIWVPPNAMQVLALLGVAEDVKRAGIEISSAELHDYRTGLLQTVETRGSRGWTNVAIHRQVLQQILADHAKTEIQFGHELQTLAQTDSDVLLQFSNSTTHRAGVVLGADGIHSAARRALFPDTRLRYSGQTSWRATVAFELPRPSAHKSLEIWAPGARFGYSAIAEKQVYWYATADAPPGGGEPPGEDKDRLARMAKRFPPPILELVSATPGAAILRTDLWDLPGLATWHHGRVLLLGDAAHPATPNLGQGGAQAIEDAWVLADVLGDARDLAPAFLELERRRKPRTRLVVTRAWQLGKLAHLGGLRRMLRNLALRATPSSILRKEVKTLYDYP
jgi:2-polyprenyl-6-methoxyphenol hydroxylase-like FAD-dependent oxidoreductase